MGRAACEGCPFAFCVVNGKIVRNYSYLRGVKQHLVLHNDIREIPELAALVDRIAEAGSLDPTLALNLNLALEEAVSNVMMYAYPKGTCGTVEVLAEQAPDRVRFTVIDAGIPFDPTVMPDADISLDVSDRPIGGLGIFLVRKIMDAVTYERREGKNILVMQKKI
jgi:anti-sigma regulatory factor (Ser/Thr protein kinase)